MTILGMTAGTAHSTVHGSHGITTTGCSTDAGAADLTGDGAMLGATVPTGAGVTAGAIHGIGIHGTGIHGITHTITLTFIGDTHTMDSVTSTEATEAMVLSPTAESTTMPQATESVPDRGLPPPRIPSEALCVAVA